MADVYYKIDGDTCYYSNVQEDSSYTLRLERSAVSSGKNVVVKLNQSSGYSDNVFIFPENAESLFYQATNTEFGNEEHWSTGVATNLSNLFYGCSNLTKLNASWDVYRCENFHATFYGCSSLKELDLRTWAVDYKGKTFSNMFDGCRDLTYIVLTNFHPKASVIGTIIPAFDSMFNNCASLSHIFVSGRTDWYKSCPDVSGGGAGMFNGCASLPNFDPTSTSLTRANNSSNEYGKGYFSTASKFNLFKEVKIYLKV